MEDWIWGFLIGMLFAAFFSSIIWDVRLDRMQKEALIYGHATVVENTFKWNDESECGVE